MNYETPLQNNLLVRSGDLIVFLYDCNFRCLLTNSYLKIAFTLILSIVNINENACPTHSKLKYSTAKYVKQLIWSNEIKKQVANRILHSKRHRQVLWIKFYNMITYLFLNIFSQIVANWQAPGHYSLRRFFASLATLILNIGKSPNREFPFWQTGMMNFLRKIFRF